MKSDLSVDQLLSIIRMREQEGMSLRAIGAEVGMHHSAVGRFLQRKTHADFWEQHDKSPIAGGSMIDPVDKRVPWTGKKVIFATTAQNNTFVHEGMLGAVEAFCKHRDADLLVQTFSYGRREFQRSEKGDGWFDKRITQFIRDEPIQLAPGLVWCGELNISPTTANPLTGLQGYSKGNSAIFGSTRQNMETVPTRKDDDPHFMYTTGVITQRNYIQRKLGQKAEFHHIFGGLIIELCDDGRWFVRQVNVESDTGNFYDLDTYYQADGTVTTGHSIAGMVPGDIHTNHIHPEIARAVLGLDVTFQEKGVIDFSFDKTAQSIMSVLKPEYVMMHDILDFHVRNHHNINDPHFRFRQYCNEDESIETELSNVAKLLGAIEDAVPTLPVVVSSNHDRALIRYIVDNVRNWADDPVNALFFLRTQTAAYEHIALDQYFDPVAWNINRIRPGLDTIWLKEDEPFDIRGNECGYHGDRGPGGVRGSLAAFLKMGLRLCIGHSHVACIRDGVFQNGITCKKTLDYAKGPSGWSWSLTLIYPNGKRTIVTLHIDNNGFARWCL